MDFNIDEKRIPEGIQNLKTETNLFILGRDYSDKIIKEIDEYDIRVNDVIDTISFVEENNDSINELKRKYNKINIVIGFKWSKNTVLLKKLCDDDFINHVYIMEGADYAWGLMFHPELKLFKHEKMIFIDSYYKGLLKRGLDYNFYKKNQEKFMETYNMLEDELSKETMMQYLNGHIRLRTFPIEKVRDTNPQYFNPDIIKLSNTETYVDCGAYDGDTILQFAHETSGKYGEIIALEPDKKMHEKLYDNIRNIDNITVFEVGAFSEKGKIGFSTENCGTITEIDANYYINVDTIDNIVNNKKVTYMKMDIEGAEMSALKGAANTIQKNKPKLAVCVYHKAEDLITIPQYIKQLVPEYKLYLRGYLDYCSEVVLYAVL